MAKLVPLSIEAHRELKSLAARQGRKLGELAEEAVRMLLLSARCEPPGATQPIRDRNAPYEVSGRDIEQLVLYGRQQGNVIPLRDAAALLQISTADARTALQAMADRKLGVMLMSGGRVRLGLAPPRLVLAPMVESEAAPLAAPSTVGLSHSAPIHESAVGGGAVATDAKIVLTSTDEKLRAAMVILEAEASGDDGADATKS